MFILINNFTSPVCDWLENVLFERFGVHFYIKVEHSKIKLLNTEGVGAIVFDKIESCFFNRGQAVACTSWDADREGWDAAGDLRLFAPGVVSLPAPLIEQVDGEYSFHYDILGLAYWMLARIEEIDSINLDDHGRFPSTASHAYRNGYLNRPVLDEWFHILSQVIARQWPRVVLRCHRPSLHLSHDVDRPFQYLFAPGQSVARQAVGDALKRWDIGLAARRCLTWHAVRNGSLQSDPYNTFDWIMDQSEAHGLRSAFYFICGRTHDGVDADYEIEHPDMRRLLRRVHERGHEIGLHPSYGTYLRPDLIKQEFLRMKRVCDEEGIQQEVWGGRMHYLRYQVPTTMNALTEAGLDYDASLGYADQAGFRCGTCFEYAAFDAVDDRALDIRIKPLLLMDGAIFGVQHRSVNYRAVLSQALQFKNSCRAVGGVFSLLWHNSELYAEWQRSAYEELLRD